MGLIGARVGVVTQSRVVLPHLDFLDAVSRKPAGSAFNRPLPEASFANRQHCRHKQVQDQPERRRRLTWLAHLTFHSLPPVQLDLSGPLWNVGPGGDEGASRHRAVQPPLPHLRSGRGRGGRAGLHMPPPTRAAGRQTGKRRWFLRILVLVHLSVPEAARVASQRVRVRVEVRLQALEGGARGGGGALQGVVAGRANQGAGRREAVSSRGSGGADPAALGIGGGFSEGNYLDT